VSELRRIASTLLGTVDIIADPADMADDFRAMIETAMGKATDNVSLRLWTPQGATVGLVRQVAPTIEELTDRALATGPLAADYPTGTWGQESRDYQLCITVAPREIGEEILAGRVSLVENDEVLAQALIKAIWTDDEQRSTQINRQVAHYTGQAKLAEAIQDGLEARKAGDVATATVKLGRAVQLAAESGNEGTMRLLAAVVDVVDAPAGTVRLKSAVADADEMALDPRSTKTVRVRRAEP
jgi:von Willebrand factor type A C-terminal domain